MSAIQFNNKIVSQASHQRAREIVADKQARGSSTVGSVLASIRRMLPGFRVSTNTTPFSGDGTRNVAIHQNTLRRMAHDPELMARHKAYLLDMRDGYNAAKNLSEQHGIQIMSMGTVIDESGNASAWTITRHTALRTVTRSVLQAPAEERVSWARQLRRHLEYLSEGNG